LVALLSPFSPPYWFFTVHIFIKDCLIIWPYYGTYLFCNRALFWNKDDLF